MSHDPNAAGLAIHWQEFGSNGLEKADYSKGVLERFTRRAKKDFHGTFKDSKGAVHALGNAHLKNISNPRYVKMADIHFHEFFEGLYRVDERGVALPVIYAYFPIVADKIAVNHYRCKSREEYFYKLKRYRDVPVDRYMIYEEMFEQFDHNEEFDDGILRYRAERAKIFRPPDNSRVNERLLNALVKNLSPTLLSPQTPDFFKGKMETFLTCRAVSSYLKTKLADNMLARNFEEASLKAILNSFAGMNLADARMFIRELPQLLSLPYPVVSDIRRAALAIIPQVMSTLRMNNLWQSYFELDYLLDMLKLNK